MTEYFRHLVNESDLFGLKDVFTLYLAIFSWIESYVIWRGDVSHGCRVLSCLGW